MTDAELRQLAEAAQSLLRPHLERSPELRTIAAIFGRWLVEQANVATDQPIAISPPSARDEPAPPSPPPPATPPVAGDFGDDAPQGSEEPEPDQADPAEAHPPTPPLPAPSSPPDPPRIFEVLPLRLGGAEFLLQVGGTPQEHARARSAAAHGAGQTVRENFSHSASEPEVDLAIIERRCRLKAESCRFFPRRRAVELDPSADPREADAARQRVAELIRAGRHLDNCFLWVFWRGDAARSAPPPVQPPDEVLVQLAENYEALADAAALAGAAVAREGRPSQAALETACALLAEATSALRIGLQGTWLTQPERDEVDAHTWLCNTTKSCNVLVQRYMRLDDPADPSPAASANLRARIKAAAESVGASEKRARQIKQHLQKVQYHTGQIAKGTLIGADAAPHWHKIAQTIAALAAAGIPPADRRIAEAIGTDAASIYSAPEPVGDPGSPTALLDSAIRRTLSGEGAQRDEPALQERVWSQNVLRVRALLAGRGIVIIGGEPRRDAVERFRAAFALPEGEEGVEWVDLVEHGPGGPMQAPIRRASTALVLVLIKLAGHLHAEEAKAAAAEAGKPCIFLTAGYNPEQAAAAILEQASRKLAESPQPAK